MKLSRFKLRPHDRIPVIGIAIVICFAIVAVSSAVALRRTATTLMPQSRHTSASNPISAENMRRGTTDWMIPRDHISKAEIQGYADATSVGPGQVITFNISVIVAGTFYQADIFRLGWYGGMGGRRVWSSRQIGQAQGYYDYTTRKLVACRSCLVDRTTGLVEARWKPSFALTIPADWVTGVYVVKLTDDRNMQTYIPFDVRGELDSDYVVVTADTTSAAYNDWGGWSLYWGPDGLYPDHAVKVSFDRPMSGWTYGQGQGLPYEIDGIRWLERQGYNVSYLSSTDLDEHPDLLLAHRAYLSIGHDEYWSVGMRAAVEHARDAGVGIAFLGADDIYWQIRFEPDEYGLPDRIVVCYKEAQNDPYYRTDPVKVTTLWQLPPVKQPENALTGVMYAGFWPPARGGFPWKVSTHPDAATKALLEGTGLRPGQQFDCDIVSYEWDSVSDNGQAPPQVHIIAESPTQMLQDTPTGGVEMLQSESDTTFYVASSGAMVFAAGSITWTFALDDLRLPMDGVSATQLCYRDGHAVAGIQRLMAKVMEELVRPS